MAVMKLALRNLLRNKRRTVITFVALVANIVVAWLMIPAFDDQLAYALNYAAFGTLLPLASLVMLKRPAARRLFHQEAPKSDRPPPRSLPLEAGV